MEKMERPDPLSKAVKVVTVIYPSTVGTSIWSHAVRFEDEVGSC